MLDFSLLIQRLDETTKTQEKLAALVDYFRCTSTLEAAHAVYFLLGNKLKPTVPTRVLRHAAAVSGSIPDWLFEETYQWVGDLAETAAVVAKGESGAQVSSLVQVLEDWLKPIVRQSGEEQLRRLVELWSRCEPFDRFVINKLLTGNLRIGVSAKLVTKALGQWVGVPAEHMQHRLMGDWEPSSQWFEQLIAPEEGTDRSKVPYPFCLAHALPVAYETLGGIERFAVEWKWDGIRAQLIRRNQQTWIWSRGEELLGGRFPEIEKAAEHLSDGTVLDGEILGWVDGKPLPFTELQRRIQRKKLTGKILQEVPVVFLSFDLLESNGCDIRTEPYASRIKRLRSLSIVEPIRLVQQRTFEDWEGVRRTKDKAREHGAEGVMLKTLDGRYEAGRVTGTWWKWKMDPYTVDAVLIYAQRGHGRRAGLFSDYTFALWDEGRLVPIAKAYSGLTDAELERVDRWIRENTTSRFGPVSEVRPELVMEIAFENIQRSTRHKSGVAVRFPRIVRIRDDKKAQDADRLDAFKTRFL